MDLHHFRYFLAIAQELHFGRAAAKLHIAQPALSIQIKKMEQQLGTPLFERTSRSVTLTEAGILFREQVEQALYYANRAETLVKQAAKGNVGHLAIGYSGSVTYSGMLGQYIQGFRYQHPKIDLQLQELDPFTQLERLLTGEIDIGFLTTFSLAIPESIATRKLMACRPCVAMPALHPLAQQPAIHIAELEDQAFITYSASPLDDGAHAIRQLADFEPKILYKQNNIMSVLALVGSGLGVAILPEVLSQTLNQPGLVFKPLANVEQLIDISLAYVNQSVKPTLGKMLDHIQTLNAASPSTHRVTNKNALD